MKITAITRRDIIDSMTVDGIDWSGRLEEPDFLARLYDMSRIPSTDHRFGDAAGDVWQHRINNLDWPDNWLFEDERFGLLEEPDWNIDEIPARRSCPGRGPFGSGHDLHRGGVHYRVHARP